MPTRRNRVMRFLNTLRNSLIRRRKKPRRSRRRRKPRMSRLRRFLNRNRNRLRTRKNVGRMPKQKQPSAFSAYKRSSTIKKCSTKHSDNKQMSVDKLTDLFAKSNVKPKTSKQFKPKLLSMKRPPIISRDLKNLKTSEQVQKLKNIIKRIEENQKKGGKRRKSKRKNKRKY